jgi:hypothetical protein
VKPTSIWIGYDTREQAAFDVARESIKKRLTIKAIPVKGIMLDDVKQGGLYWRPTEQKDGRLWDVISGAFMSTEFAISRFLVPHLATQGGYAAFLDCDVMAKGNLCRLFNEVHDQRGKAVYCVKHNHIPENLTKMDGQAQTAYPRKNWSSVMVFDCDHPSNKKLTVDLINGARGLDLHQFCWLQDDEIGELDGKWNYLNDTLLPPTDPKIVHFTEGGPWMRGYEDVPYAQEWRAELRGFVCR